MRALMVWTAAVVSAAGCYGYYDGPGGVAGTSQRDTTTAPPSQTDIVMRNSAFDPSVDTVLVGQLVTWRNLDSLSHTVTTDSVTVDTFDSGALQIGETFHHSFQVPGRYPYVSRTDNSPDRSMRGTIVVLP